MKALLATIVLAAVTQVASAEVSVRNAWARATPPGSTVGVVYGELIATSTDELVSISTNAAERAEVHTTLNEGGTMKMRPMHTVALPTGTRVRFGPGGMHMMLIGLREPLKAGTTIAITMHFRSAPALTFDATVLAPGAPEPSG